MVSKVCCVNDVEGLCMIGYFYQKGYWGIKQNTSIALRYYAMAADTGNFNEMVDIARKFFIGSKFPQEEKVAADIIDAAAKAGNAAAQFYLAKCYQAGMGVNVDIEKAIELYKMASGNGYQEATSELQDLQATLSFSEKIMYKIKG